MWPCTFVWQKGIILKWTWLNKRLIWYTIVLYLKEHNRFKWTNFPTPIRITVYQLIQMNEYIWWCKGSGTRRKQWGKKIISRNLNVMKANNQLNCVLPKWQFLARSTGSAINCHPIDFKRLVTTARINTRIASSPLNFRSSVCILHCLSSYNWW